MTTTTTREPGYETYWNAIDADNAWQAELDRQGVERYSMAARGETGSRLRELYEAKVAADVARFHATINDCTED